MIDPPQPGGAAENGFMAWLTDAFVAPDGDTVSYYGIRFSEVGA